MAWENLHEDIAAEFDGLAVVDRDGWAPEVRGAGTLGVFRERDRHQLRREHARSYARFYYARHRREVLARIAAENAAEKALARNQTCEECGGPIPFERRRDAKVCGRVECERARDRRWQEEARARRQAQRHRRRERELAGRTCQHCGEVIPTSKRRGAKWCSKRCGNAAKVARRREAKELPAEKVERAMVEAHERGRVVIWDGRALRMMAPEDVEVAA